MPSILYGTGAYTRTNGNFPPLELINMYVEKAKTSENEIALISRKGLATSYTVGTGPINGIYAKRGTFDGDVFTISNATLFRDTASIGAVNGTGVASFASSASEVVFTRGATPQSYDGTDLVDVTFPDTAAVVAVEYIGNLFVFARADSHKFYWSTALDGRTVDALDFASAEREPDQLLDIKSLGDNLWMFGQSTIECWAHTGEADLPFTRFEQVGFDKGIHSTGAAVKADNSIIFVGSDNTVYRIDEVPLRISDHSIEERIGASATVKLFAYKYEGHEFIGIRLDGETLVIDLTTGEWHENQTSAGNWIAADATMVGATPYFGHSSTGAVMTFSGILDIAADVQSIFTAALQLDTPQSVDCLRLWANTGHPTVTDAAIEMATSDDAGATFGAFESTEMGDNGEYRTRAEWRALGMFDDPGAMFKFRSTAPLRISAVKINDKKGGRARA